MLNRMMEALKNRGINPPEGLGKAEGEMRGAQGSLGESDRGTALGQQGRAMENLREGAQAMANEMMRQAPAARAQWAGMKIRAARRKILTRSADPALKWRDLWYRPALCSR